jgi:hypothetical protein
VLWWQVTHLTWIIDLYRGKDAFKITFWRIKSVICLQILKTFWAGGRSIYIYIYIYICVLFHVCPVCVSLSSRVCLSVSLSICLSVRKCRFACIVFMGICSLPVCWNYLRNPVKFELLVATVCRAALRINSTNLVWCRSRSLENMQLLSRQIF